MFLSLVGSVLPGGITPLVGGFLSEHSSVAAVISSVLEETLLGLCLFLWLPEVVNSSSLDESLLLDCSSLPC